MRLLVNGGAKEDILSTILGLFMKKIIFAIGLLLYFPVLAEDSSQNPSMVVHLLDYLAKDYGGAVQDGKIINQSEYAEQIEFAEIVEKAVHSMPDFKTDSDFKAKVSQFHLLVRNKGAAEEVAKAARALQTRAIILAKIQMSPIKWPDLPNGQKLFGQYCTSCHGSTGLGDGPDGRSLNPPPSNFSHPDNMTVSSPFLYFNTIRLGVPGTGMVPFTNLSDEDIWDLAFYVKSLGHQNKVSLEEKPKLSLHELASLSDNQALEKLEGSVSERQKELSGLRTYTPKLGTEYFLGISADFLEKSLKEYVAGNSEAALSLALKAYLEGIEPIEPKIKANDDSLVIAIEDKMANYREGLKSKLELKEVTDRKNAALGTIQVIKDKLSTESMSPSMAFVAAFSIFLREGFEAVLIIIVLLSVTKAMGASRANKWIHFGWGSALILGLVLWFASGFVLNLSGASRELMEASVSLFAVVVLIYMGFWLHRHSEIKKWKELLKAKVKSATDNKNLVVLSSISFIAVFREAFEVVLFLRAIWFELDKGGRLYASAGIFASFCLIFSLAFLVLRSSRNVPISLLFKVCSAIMVLLSFVLLGKAIHSFQESGFAPITSFALLPRFDLLGLFPTMETLLAQFMLLLLMAYLLARTRMAKSRFTK